jgi:SAM-dependent methyltransferase
MRISPEAALAILQHNLGFDCPEQWVEYAIQHAFKSTDARPVPNCPDCGDAPSGELGQYVYYSTLFRLKECGSCHLIWADAHLDPHVLKTHFEANYKSRDYFRDARLSIFRHLVKEIARVTPPRGAVLDFGGAQGDLMHLLKEFRPDVSAVVHDVSEISLRHAAEQFALPTICGDLDSLASHHGRFHVVVLSDALYYEPRIADFWRVLPRLLAPGGSIVLRVPNKLPLIRAHQRLSRWLGYSRAPKLEDNVKYFNPEHIYVLSRRYLTTRLARAGFASVRVVPSPPLRPSASMPKRAATGILFPAAQPMSLLSGRRLVLTPSMLVIGTGLAARDQDKPVVAGESRA